MERDFAGIRTGRASTALVERIAVDYYGTSTPLNQLAGISTPDAHLIVIQPWDRGALPAIEKAITRSDIGLVPNVDGTVVRLHVPPLSEERRHELVRQVRRRLEEARDEERRELENLQRLTDGFVEMAESRGERKETEIMEV
jgi:ribosome recycling factor